MKLFAIGLAFTALAAAAEIKLGKPLTLKEAVTVSEVIAKPANFVGKTVQVKGKITEVCQMAGCWMSLTDNSGETIRIKVNDGDIVFPKDGAGKTAIAEGKLARIEMTREQVAAQAEHEAEEAGRKFDASRITSGKTVYQIQGTGAVIID